MNATYNFDYHQLYIKCRATPNFIGNREPVDKKRDCRLVKPSLVPRPRAPPGEKRSGERSQISWAYYPKRVITNEIARSVIIR